MASTTEKLNLSANFELTPIQEREKREVEEQFGEFWKTNLRISRGFSTPFFSRDEIRDYLSEAAEDIVIIRSQLEKDFNESDPMWNVLCGNAREYLWNLSNGAQRQHPFENTQEFVRSLVKSTFKDSAGYRGTLSEQVIDGYVDEINNWRKSRVPEREKKLRNLEEEIDKHWTEVKGLWDQAKSRGQLSQNNNDDLFLTNAEAVVKHLAIIKDSLKSLNEREVERHNRQDNERKWKEDFASKRKAEEEQRIKDEEENKAKAANKAEEERQAAQQQHLQQMQLHKKNLPQLLHLLQTKKELLQIPQTLTLQINKAPRLLLIQKQFHLRIVKRTQLNASMN